MKSRVSILTHQKLSKEEAQELSQPFLTRFNPYVIPMQGKVVDLIRGEWDYKKGTPEILLSGSYGSSKSALLAHLAVTHCYLQRYSRVCICRRALPDLKKTLFQEILEHISEDLVEGKDYKVNTSTASIKFKNGSEIISMTWADKRYKKGRSLRLSMLIIEELTENDEQDFEAFKTLKARVRRLPAIKENVVICATNPDDPETIWYKYFIASQPHATRRVFYSNTEDNPFLDPIYIEQLKKDLDPISVRRYLYGEWVSLQFEGIYYCYDPKKHYLKETEYQFNHQLPLDITWDFNIGENKPLSIALGQYDPLKDMFHVERSICINSISTHSMLDELQSRGYFDQGLKIRIFGDATGQARSTQSLHSNYEIIKNYLSNYLDKQGRRVVFEMKVPRSNPPVRARHNHVNSYLENGNKQNRLLLYKWAQKLDEGLRLTKLKKGGDYTEDDSKDYQHVTTSLGYWVSYLHNLKGVQKIGSHRRY